MSVKTIPSTIATLLVALSKPVPSMRLYVLGVSSRDGGIEFQGSWVPVPLVPHSFLAHFPLKARVLEGS